MAQPNPQAFPGIAHFWPPHELWNPQNNGPDPQGNAPPAHIRPWPFAFHDNARNQLYDLQLPNQTTLAPLVQLEGASTQVGSHTKPTKRVQNLEKDKRIHVLKKCSELNARLYQYGDPNIGVQPVTPEQQAFHNGLYTQHNGWGHKDRVSTAGPAENSFPYPSGIQQYNALFALACWFSQNMSNPQAQPVTSEPSVQDQVILQLLAPIDHILKADQLFTEDNDESKKSKELIQRCQNTNLFFPVWLRATHALNSVKAKDTAGFPDYLLMVDNRGIKSQSKAIDGETGDITAEASEQEPSGGNSSLTTTTTKIRKVNFELSESEPAPPRKPQREQPHFQQVAVEEIKSFWSYDDNGLSATQQTAYKFIKQFWGEFIFFKSHWGFATNGRKVTICVRIQNKHINEFIAGEAMDWDDPRLIQTMAGFCFASIDDQLRPGLREFLCAGSVFIMSVGDHGGGGGDGGNEDGGNGDGDNGDRGAAGRDHDNNGGRQGGDGHNAPGDGPSGNDHSDQGRADDTTGGTTRRSTRTTRPPQRGGTMAVPMARSKPSATSAPSTSKKKQ
ncbi:hypothetical protein C8Q74DRAFT_1221455 [Fomes fomentarius]|nr:hypothetical protein C8Q74DRAFT_1221455 [Fomes fomentarius]